ncbi:MULTISPECIES: PQQ-binding-like beta-propeller repeat protein [unclassified Brachybacterium]|uniref:outer membrane protein assembly factor BamB family protein n=1 Tax=unclassified Brachybacterium TaxID=2623841 RepID=UPI003620E17D
MTGEPEHPQLAGQPATEPPDEQGTDAATALGVAVVLLALAGICALLGAHVLVGALRLAAGVLAGAAVAAAVFAVPLPSPERLPRLRRPRVLLAAALAVLVAGALTVPAVLSTRVGSLEARASASIDALAEGDRVHSVPGVDAPVLVRRAEGTAELLSGTRVETVEAAPEDVVALSADGSRLVHTTGTTTRVLTLSADAPPVEEATVDGAPLALSGDLLVVRYCDGVAAACYLEAHDVTADDPAEAVWALSASGEARGSDPAAVEVAARSSESPDLLDAVRATGILPAVPLRFDPAQGWVQLDPETGFPVGQVLAAPEADCRIAATGAAPDAADGLVEPEPVVLTVCSGDDGALTATAYRDGEVLWESEPSPAGDWRVRLDRGRVIATGTEDGSDVAGELVASQQRAAWTAPGGDGLEQVAPFTTRIGIDGARMVVTNDQGQLLAYDTADGTNLWTQPSSPTGDGVRGSLEASTAVVLDPLERTRALDPRGAQRLRILDAATGEVTHESVVDREVDAIHPVGAGRALVTTGDSTLLLGP